MEETRLLKKHANRRLYDTESKSYVSLEQIREIIDSGVDVKIEDSKSGADITRPVLLQIMAECEQGEQPMLSPALLMTLIRHYGHPMQDIVGSYLESSLVYYMRQEARLRKRMTGMFESIEAKTSEGAKAGRETLAAMRDNLMQVLRSNKHD
jgi:polyhydroxyalkanoate synthesis repressor PhaR